MPEIGSVIKFPRVGRIKNRGASEISLEDCIRNHLINHNIKLFTERFLIRGTGIAPYEPDLSLQDEATILQTGKYANLFIDIEIDEPYDFATMLPTHCKDEDNFRNKYFNDFGWVVIRFSEKQVITNVLGCVLHVAKVISSLMPNKFFIPDSLSQATPLQNEMFWDRFTAQKWIKESYRQTYLGLGMITTGQIEIEYDYNNLNINETENEAEKNRKKQPEIAPLETKKGRWWNIRNEHPRDSKVIFHPFEHKYEIANDFEYSSASEVAKLLFNEFDLDGQALRLSIQRNKSIEEIKNGFIRDKELGTQLHRDIENWFENNNYQPTNETLTEFNFFVDYYQQELGGQYPYRTEWAIYDNINKIAGTVDLVIRKPDGSFAIYDWKRTKSFFNSPLLTGTGICSVFPDGNLSIYTIQAHIYKKILKDFYGIKNVTEVFLVQLHPQPFTNNLQANPVNISDANILAQYGINMDELIDELFKLVRKVNHR